MRHVFWLLLLLALAAGTQQLSSLIPGDAAPRTKLSIWKHTSTDDASYTLGKSTNVPVIVQLYDVNSLFTAAMWADSSFPLFLEWLSTNDQVEFLILPVNDPNNTAVEMFASAVGNLPNDEDLRRNVRSRFHVGVDLVNKPQTAWLGGISSSWPNTATWIVTSANFSIQRIDAQFWWELPPPPQGEWTYTYVGDACAALLTPLPPNTWALVSATTKCSSLTQLENAQGANASGVIMIAESGVAFTYLTCGDPNGDECNDPSLPSIPATSVTYENGQLLIQALLADPDTTVSFVTEPASAMHFSVDAYGKLCEIGWVLWPSWDFMQWAAQELAFKISLKSQIETVYASHSQVEVTRNQFFYNQLNVQTFPLNITHYRSFQFTNSLFIDMKLACNGSFDTNCPIWDYVLAAYVCCELPCSLSEYGPYGMELGRWITPFRRDAGRWLTDVSPLLSLLSSPTCNITIALPPELGSTPWVISFSLLFGTTAEYPSTYAKQLLPLWNGQFTFDSTYNLNHQPIKFSRPNGAKRALLYTVITGHGSDNNNCAEFCETTHLFQVNGKTFNITYSQAGTALGCTLAMSSGALANQHGTWIYGRDGWCDGSNVKPIVYDITHDLVPGNSTNIITYIGLYNDSTPDPSSSPGNMVVATFIVWEHAGHKPNYVFAIVLLAVVMSVLLMFGMCALWQKRCATQAQEREKERLLGAPE